MNPDFVTILQIVGFPAAVLVIFGWAVWRSIIWVSIHVVNPLIESHKSFLESMVRNSDRHTELLESIHDAVKSNGELMKMVKETRQ